MSGRSEPLAPAPASRFRLPVKSTGVLSPDQRALALSHARALLGAPTTSYHEDGPMQVIRAFVKAHPGFSIEQDEYCNLLVRTTGRRGRTELAFSAHLDHPGFHYLGKQSGRHRVQVVGGIADRCLPGASVRFHDPRTQVAVATATIDSVRKGQNGNSEATLRRFRGHARPGMFGVFDFTSGSMRGSRLHARVCDDLMGAAAILSTLELLALERHPRSVVGIFTRAEETGFIGCLGLMRSSSNLDMEVIGLECSPQRPSARPGRGPVIRVGDRMSVFDPELTQALEDAAAEVAAEAPGFRWQRALMDGGSCESTVYNAFGVRAAGVCLALGNYHNCTPGGAAAAEYVDWTDYEGLIALLAQSARNLPARRPREKIMGRLNRLWEREYKLLELSAKRMQKGNVP